MSQDPTSAEVLAYAPQFYLSGVTRTIGDLVFTGDLVFFVQTIFGLDLLLVTFGYTLRTLVERRSRSRSQVIRTWPVSDLLTSATLERRYHYPHLDSIQITPRPVRASRVVLRLRSGRTIVFRGELPDLGEVLNRVPSLIAAGAPIALSTQLRSPHAR